MLGSTCFRAQESREKNWKQKKKHRRPHVKTRGGESGEEDIPGSTSRKEEVRPEGRKEKQSLGKGKKKALSGTNQKGKIQKRNQETC